MKPLLPKPTNEPIHEKDSFMRSVIRELAGILEQSVGKREAEAYVNYVGLVLGRSIDGVYREAFATEKLTLEQVAAALVDLKARIDGQFSVVSIDDERIELVNAKCPFGDKVIGRPSLCRMTANVFGSVAAENVGYARVQIEEAIARGDPRCRVIVSLKRTDGATLPEGTEFFGGTY